MSLDSKSKKTHTESIINLRQIEVFRAVMIAGSITGASELLHISAPAVSRLISHTESRLNFKLFERLKRRLHPTPEAHQLFSEVERVYESVRRVNKLARAFGHSTEGHLRIACSPSLAPSLLPLAIEKFTKKHPGVHISLEIFLAEPLIDALISKRSELAVAIVPLEHPLIHVHALLQNRIVVILPPRHHLLKKTQIHIHDLENERLIGYSADTPLSRAINRVLDGAKVTPHPVAEVNQTQVACAMVQRGIGLALIDKMAVLSGAWPSLEARELVPTINLQVRVAYSRTQPLSALARAFAELLESLDLRTSDLVIQNNY